MKEQVAIRLYENPAQRAQCQARHYRVADGVAGWDFGRGDSVGLEDCDGGYLMGVIDHVGPAVHEDSIGRYRIAELWTQD